MDKDEMKNRISLALKDPILQQGFEIICKDLAISEHDREHNDYELTEVYKNVEQLEKEVAGLKDDNMVMADNYSKMEQKFYVNLNKAKEIIKKMSYEYQRLCLIKKETLTEAEQYLKDLEK